MLLQWLLGNDVQLSDYAATVINLRFVIFLDGCF